MCVLVWLNGVLFETISICIQIQNWANLWVKDLFHPIFFYFFLITQVVNANNFSLNNSGLSRFIVVFGNNFLLNCKFSPRVQFQKFIEWAVWFSEKKNNNTNNKNRNTLNEWMHLFLPAWIVFGFILPTRGCDSFQSCLLPSWAPRLLQQSVWKMHT